MSPDTENDADQSKNPSKREKCVRRKLTRELSVQEAEQRAEGLTDAECSRYLLRIMDGGADWISRVITLDNESVNIDYVTLSTETGIPINVWIQWFTSFRATITEKLNIMIEAEKQLRQAIGSLASTLDANYEILISNTDTRLHERTREKCLCEVLQVVRLCVARVLPNDFAEGLGEADLDDTEGILLEFAKSVLTDQTPDIKKDLSTFCLVLSNYDGNSVQSDLDAIDAGVRVIIDLAGSASLFGVFAQLNLIAPLFSTLALQDFAHENIRLAGLADALHGDLKVEELRRRIRGLSEHQIPSPVRLSSYCRSNAIFTLLEAALDGETIELAEVEELIRDVAKKDRSFELQRAHELGLLVAKIERGDSAAIESLRGWPDEKVSDARKHILLHIPRPKLREAVVKMSDKTVKK